jgi:hypothetical protein
LLHVIETIPLEAEISERPVQLDVLTKLRAAGFISLFVRLVLLAPGTAAPVLPNFARKLQSVPNTTMPEPAGMSNAWPTPAASTATVIEQFSRVNTFIVSELARDSRA